MGGFARGTAVGVVGLALLVTACAGGLSEEQQRKLVAHRDLGTFHLQKGQTELAIREYREALAVWEADPQANYAIGEAYRQKRAFEDAERHLRRALELKPDLHDARLNLGGLYLQQERWAEAIRENELLLRDPTFLRPARALVNLGWAHYKSGNRGEAERRFQEAVESDGGNYQARLNLGIVLYERSELVEAIRQFGEAARLLENRPASLFGAAEAEARFRMAMAHVRLGQRDRALEHLRVAADRGGETEWAERSRTYLAVLE